MKLSAAQDRADPMLTLRAMVWLCRGGRVTGPMMFTAQVLRESGMPAWQAGELAARVPFSWPWRGQS